MDLTQIFFSFLEVGLYLLLWMLFPMYLGKKAAILTIKIEYKIALSSWDIWIIYPLATGLFALMIFYLGVPAHLPLLPEKGGLLFYSIPVAMPVAIFVVSFLSIFFFGDKYSHGKNNTDK